MKFFRKINFAYVFIIGTILIITGSFLLSEGMFMDGIIYTAVAHNLSQGIGSIWDLTFSETLWKNFYEHPPLAIAFQSFFFDIFGSNLWVDKLYSILTFLIVGVFMQLILSLFKLQYSWVSLLFWFSIPLVTWAIPNNLLENTVAVFTTISVFLYLKSQSGYKFLFIALSGLAISLGFLSKGFVAFFPLIMPLIIGRIIFNKSLKNIIIDSLILLVFASIPLVLLFAINQQAYNSIISYLNIQVYNGLVNIAEVKNVDSRFFIVERVFLELLPALGITLIIFVISKFKNKKILSNRKFLKESLAFFLLGLAGVLPIMISTKQSGFYILATFPLFAIAFTFFNYAAIELFFNTLLKKRYLLISIKIISIIIFLGGLSLSLLHINIPSRDKDKLKDIKNIINYVKPNEIIYVNNSLWMDWSLHGYMVRYGQISLDSNATNNDYCLTLKDQNKNNFELEYTDTIYIGTYYNLFQKI